MSKISILLDELTSKKIYQLEDAIIWVGSENKYQWRILLIMSLILVAISVHVTGQTFLFAEPLLDCDGQECNQFPDWCNGNFEITVSSKYKQQTIVTEYQLWCQRYYLIPISQSVYFLGNFLGGNLMSYLAVINLIQFNIYQDIYGRRKIYIISWGIATVGAIGIFTMKSIYQYIIMNLILGFGTYPCYIIEYVILYESCGIRFRQTGSVLLLAVHGLAAIMAAVLYYLIDSWKMVYGLFVALPAIIGFFLSFFIKETPSFYSMKKNIFNLIQTLDEIAVINDKEKFSILMPYLKNKLSSQFKIQNDQNSVNSKKTYNFIDLFKYSSLRRYSMGLIIVVITLNLVFYGGQYSLDTITYGDTLYILGALVGTVELFSYLAIRYVIHKLPRKLGILWHYIISIALCACFFIFGYSSNATKFECTACLKKILVLSLACLIRIFNSFGYAIESIYANEIYPTCVRALGTGMLLSVGVVGSFFAPYMIALGEILQINPYFLIGAILLIAPLATLLLKETLGQNLEDEIEELKDTQNVQEMNIIVKIK